MPEAARRTVSLATKRLAPATRKKIDRRYPSESRSRCAVGAAELDRPRQPCTVGRASVTAEPAFSHCSSREVSGAKRKMIDLQGDIPRPVVDRKPRFGRSSRCSPCKTVFVPIGKWFVQGKERVRQRRRGSQSSMQIPLRRSQSHAVCPFKTRKSQCRAVEVEM